MSSLSRGSVIKRITKAADTFGSGNPQQLKQLVSYCRKGKEAEVFFGLFSFFYDEELQDNQFERQNLAGKVLLAVTPDSPLELDGSVYASARHWNLSIEELPWYWCKKFGKATVVGFLEDLIPEVEEGELKRSTETLLFWSRKYVESNT